MKQKRHLFFILIFLPILACGCRPKVEHNSFFSMGTVVEVISPDPRAQEIVFQEFSRLEKIFNLYDDQSELSRLNAFGELQASLDLFELLEESKDFFIKTDGIFDASIAPLSLLWKRAIPMARPPQKKQIQEVMALVGFDDVYLNRENRLVKLLKDGMKLDLGGIAKGYALDEAVARLRQAGVHDVLINAGGDIYCLGKNRNQPWRIGIQDPRHKKHNVMTLALQDEACGTSGDYEQFFIFKDRRYSHIIDPTTGYPADSDIIAATVLSPSAVTAVVLAKVCMVAGPVRAQQVLKKFNNAKVYVIYRNGAVSEITGPEFQE